MWQPCIKISNDFPQILPDKTVCETKLNNSNNLDLIMLNKYTFHYTNSFSKAGVGIYTNNSITYTLRTDLIFYSASYKSNWVELPVGENSKKSINKTNLTPSRDFHYRIYLSIFRFSYLKQVYEQF